MGHELVRILFELEADAWHGVATERLWADRVAPGRYRLRNTPFFAFGVSCGDIVSGEEHDGQVVFRSVTIKGGHSSYRIRPTAEIDSDAFRECWVPIEGLGCTFEQGRVLAVDIPAATDIHRVHELLEAGESAGVWQFEEGDCGHAIE